MTWGGFCGGIKSELVFVPGKAKLDSASYVTLLWNHIWFLYGIGAVRSMGGWWWWRMVHQATRDMLKDIES